MIEIELLNELLYKVSLLHYYIKFYHLQVTCYCCLPLRTTSRIWGWLTSIELPVSLRPKLYRFYASLFHANLDEIELDLSAFPNLVEFFVRTLKQNARPIAANTNMVAILLQVDNYI